MTDISIVTGTYNRIKSLQRMVESARQSKVLGLSIDFIIVSGGATDGTIEWIELQPDITLIEHGELRGAVKAFNDGAYASQADYVILANDDIEFIGQSILIAYQYMQDNSDCGIGCFYQDRERQSYKDNDPNKWYVAEMPAVENGRQVWRPYGQVCIVPRWLGNHVGWWGDYLHTYGGDNELSSQVYELGFKVSPVPGAKISDHEIQDDLRKINNFGHGRDPKKSGGHHPDSWNWGKKWQFSSRRDNETGRLLTGPTIRFVPALENQVAKKHRVVYLPIYEAGWAVQKEQKRGLREALAKVAIVEEFDYITKFNGGKEFMLADLYATMDRIKPTILLTQLHNGAQIDSDDIGKLRQLWPDTRFVNWNGDFWPENLLSPDGIKLAKSFDLQLTVNRDALKKYQDMGIDSDYWQIGYEPDGIGCESTTTNDVVFLASGYSKARQELVKKIKELDIDFALYGQGWPSNWAKGQNLYNFKEGCQVYRGAKISIGDSQWPETGFVSNRVFQALAAGGSALAHQYFRDMDKLGLIDGETCIIWKDFAELKTKIDYYLKHEKERKAIALAGEQLAITRHSFDVRVQELLDMLEDKVSVEASWRW